MIAAISLRPSAARVADPLFPVGDDHLERVVDRLLEILILARRASTSIAAAWSKRLLGRELLRLELLLVLGAEPDLGQEHRLHCDVGRGERAVELDGELALASRAASRCRTGPRPTRSPIARASALSTPDRTRAFQPP